MPPALARHPGVRCAVFTVLAASVYCAPLTTPAAFAASASAAVPPPGEYRVDQESNTRSKAGPVTLELIQKTDGATGAITQIRRSSIDGNAVTQAFVGAGPVRACVRVGEPPASVAALACNTSSSNSPASPPSSGVASYQTQCAGLRQADQWRRIDDQRWEHRFTVVPQTTATASAGTVPAATMAAMAPVIQAMQESIRNGTPAEAEAVRQQLLALQGGMGASGAAPNDVSTEVVERWTRIADTCSKAR